MNSLVKQHGEDDLGENVLKHHFSKIVKHER